MSTRPGPAAESGQVSLYGRAALVVILTIGFYLLIGGLVGLLVFSSTSLLSYNGQSSWAARVAAAGCVFSAVALLWNAFRGLAYSEPGRPVEKASAGGLISFVREVAEEIDPRLMPAEIRITPYLNAGVWVRGGRLGFGGERVLSLGLPLLEALTILELKAVLAHEFGHYQGQDTVFGRWAAAMNGALLRPVIYAVYDQRFKRLTSGQFNPLSVAAIPMHMSVLALLLYWRMFVLFIGFVSHMQERAADQVAARLVGAEHLISALSRLQTASGTQRDARDPYDTHPPIDERIRRLRELADGGPAPSSVGGSELLAINLLDNPEGLGALATGVARANPRAIQRDADRRLRRAAGLGMIGSLLLLVGLFPPQVQVDNFSYSLATSPPDLWSTLVLVVLTAGGCAFVFSPHVDRLIGPGILLGALPVTGSGILGSASGFVISLPGSSGLGLGFWVELVASLCLVVATFLAGAAVAATPDLRLTLRPPSDTAAWLVVLLGIAGAAAYALDVGDGLRNSTYLNGWVVLPDIWAVMATALVAAWAAMLVQRKLGIAVLAGWIGSGVCLFASAAFGYAHGDVATRVAIVAFGCVLLGLFVVVRAFARTDQSWLR